MSIFFPVVAVDRLLTHSTNKQGGTIEAGQVCAVHSSGVGFVLANASDNTKLGFGLAVQQIANNAAGDVQTSGLMQLSDWTNVVGTVSLAARARYWLDVINGKLTSTSPNVLGNVVQFICEAVSSDTMLIQIGPYVKL